MSTVAKVHSYESFGTVDGPGIRFVVFFQGCHLKCQYCHNRDLWSFSEGKEIPVKEIFREIQKYKPFFQASDGGVTISGGDPILQPKAVTEIFKLCKKESIHTTLDTSGAVEITDDIIELLTYTDLVLLDIKHIDPKKSIKLTGLDNSLTLKFAEHLSSIDKSVWIRHVVVPNLSDSSVDCDKLASFISKLNAIERVELLPFHKMGEFKWRELNENYALTDVEPPSNRDMVRVKSIFEKYNLPVSIPER